MQYLKQHSVRIKYLAIKLNNKYFVTRRYSDPPLSLLEKRAAFSLVLSKYLNAISEIAQVKYKKFNLKI